jgi:hypothetical protein
LRFVLVDLAAQGDQSARSVSHGYIA